MFPSEHYTNAMCFDRQPKERQKKLKWFNYFDLKLNELAERRKKKKNSNLLEFSSKWKFPISTRLLCTLIDSYTVGLEHIGRLLCLHMLYDMYIVSD